MNTPRFRTLRRLAALAVLVASAGPLAAAEGEVRKIDKAQGKVTIKHGELKNLDMPPMTMVFRARPASLLNDLAEGDLISFDADKIDGQYTVTAIRKK
ncbi:MAG: copper-binding protein [Ferribacterium limneticum]